MKKKIAVIMCSLLLALPALSFAQGKTGPDPNVSAYEHADENAKFKRDEDVFNSKENKEIKDKWLAEKDKTEVVETEKKEQKALEECERRYRVNELDPNVSQETKKKMLEAREKCERQYRREVPDSGVSAARHADENARFERGEEEYNNKENKTVRAEKRAEKREEKETERKEKAEKDQDKGEGQFKVKF